MIEELEEEHVARMLRAPLRLASAKILQPYGQGDLDGLCGLYAAVNGLRLVAAERRRPLSDDQCLTLFRHGASFLNEHAKLSAAVRYGLRARLWVQLVVELASKAMRLLRTPIVAHRPLAAVPAVTIELLIDTARAAIRSGQAVLVLLKGAYDHYTVVSGVSATRFSLFDSYGYRWVTLASCSLVGEGPARRHRLHAASLTVMG